MNEAALLEDLKRAAEPPLPSGFVPGIRYSGGSPQDVVTPWISENLETEDEWRTFVIEKMGVYLPDHLTLELAEARFNQGAWHRDNQGEDAVTRPMWIYRFKVVPRSLRADHDLKEMMKDAAKRVRATAPPVPKNFGTSFVVNLSDFQVGKVDELGGTESLLERSESALARVVAKAKRLKPTEIILVDPGDSTEGFNSAPNAARTNDLQQTEQIRVWRRIFWRWTTALSPLAPALRLVVVPSNHCRVRQGKDVLGPPNDDWGIEVASQIDDMARTNPAYDHVTVTVPRAYEEHVTVTLAGGRILSVAHGHQKRNPNQLTDWAKSHGRGDIGVSDVVVVGHFHHLRVVTYGDNQTLFVCPTMDNGSSWFTPQSGERSRPGVLTFVVDGEGWRDMEVMWA